MTYWHVGQKIVCISSLIAPYGVRIEKDAIYTIREIIRRPGWDDDAVGFALQEILCLRREDGEDCWHEKHFRPLRTTSIECFETILRSVEADEDCTLEENLRR